MEEWPTSASAPRRERVSGTVLVGLLLLLGCVMSGRASNNIPPSLLKIWKEEDSKMSSPQKYTGRAIVSHDKLPNKGWKMEDRVTCREPREDELVVEMVASGICHTDVHFGSADPLPPLMFYPRVMGHEGQ